jgi:hypothetical protein
MRLHDIDIAPRALPRWALPRWDSSTPITIYDLIRVEREMLAQNTYIVYPGTATFSMLANLDPNPPRYRTADELRRDIRHYVNAAWQRGIDPGLRPVYLHPRDLYTLRADPPSHLQAWDNLTFSLDGRGRDRIYGIELEASVDRQDV